MTLELTWSESFSVGHPDLDEEHRALIGAINAICAERTADSNLDWLLGELGAAATRHFQHEDSILRAVIASNVAEGHGLGSLSIMGEDVLNEHIDEHRCAVDQLQSITDAAASGGPPCEALKKWFFDHAVKSDAHLKALFQAIENEHPALFRQLTQVGEGTPKP